ncbi:MAG: PAS domain S-box protein [Planctomycetes bacterium]|nr:PAS domain S-box protein [Planctomycetota bacterium]
MPVWTKLVLLYTGVVAFVFLGFGVIEHLLSGQGASPGTISTLHAVRGLSSGLLVGIAVAFFLLQYHPMSARPQTDFGPSDADRPRWFVSLRWVAASVALGVVACLGLFGLLPLPLTVRLAGWLALLAAFNGFCAWRIRSKTLTPITELQLQMVGDLLLLTLLLSLIGGVSNPLTGLYFVHVVLSAILLGSRAAFLTALASSALLFGLLAASRYGLLPASGSDSLHLFPSLTSSQSVLVVISLTGLMLALAYLAGMLAGRLREQARRNEELAAGIARERAKLTAAVEQMSEGVLFTDLEGRPFFINSAMKRLWGAGPHPDRNILDCHPPGYHDAVRERIEQLKAGPHLRFHREVRRNGRILETTLAPIVSDSQQVYGIVQVTRDVTEQRQIQEQMVRQEKLSVLGRLACTVAHEVNNPLTAIAMFAELILKHPEQSPSVAEHARTILGNIQSCKRIVQQLLSYASPGQTHRMSLDVGASLEETVSLLRPIARKHGVDIIVPNGRAPVMVYADPDQLRQVFTNLLMNAMKAVEDASVRRIEIHVECRGKVALVSFRDTGPGILPEHQSHVFEPFFTTQSDGTGLGLTLVKEIVERHKGRVWFESPPGKGAWFSVELPLYESSADR